MASINAHGDKLTFRAWLVRQLTVTRWPSVDPTPALAAELGVTLDVLEEAYGVLEAAAKRRGKPRTRHGKRVLARTDYALVRVYTPPAVHRIWHAYRKILHLNSGAVLRSLVHHFLQNPARPTTTSESWHLGGKVYKLEGRSLGDHRKNYPNICTRITRGAEVALDHHAAEWNVPPTTVIRGLVVDLLESRVKRLVIVGYPELWGDPDRYLHPEKFR